MYALAYSRRPPELKPPLYGLLQHHMVYMYSHNLCASLLPDQCPQNEDLCCFDKLLDQPSYNHNSSDHHQPKPLKPVHYHH
ncbi:Uncharacterised protein [Vibrio cholerae]|nr:Uncharacterised protein [Vibrio cholerae]